MEKSSDTITTIRLRGKQYGYALEVMEFFQISWNDVVKSAMYLLYYDKLSAFEYLLSRQNKSSMSKEEFEMWFNKKVQEKKISVRLNKEERRRIMYQIKGGKGIKGSENSLTKYLYNALNVIYFPDNEKHIYDKLGEINVQLEQLVERRNQRPSLGNERSLGRANYVMDQFDSQEHYRPEGIDLSEHRHRIGIGNSNDSVEKIKKPSEEIVKKQRRIRDLKEIQNEKIEDLENNIQLLDEWIKESKDIIKNIKKL